jgi:hypothetical protein
MSRIQTIKTPIPYAMSMFERTKEMNQFDQDDPRYHHANHEQQRTPLNIHETMLWGCRERKTVTHSSSVQH